MIQSKTEYGIKNKKTKEIESGFCTFEAAETYRVSRPHCNDLEIVRRKIKISISEWV